MTDNKPPLLTVPATVREWVQANPLPTLLITEDLVSLATNGAFDDLLSQLNLSAEDILRPPLTDNESSTAAGGGVFKSLKKGECIVRRMTVSENEHFTFHLIKLDLPSAGSCLCCMLIPGEDPSEIRLTGILNAIACFVVEIDARGGVFYINDELMRHLGYAHGELKQLVHLRQLQHNFGEEVLARQIQTVESTGLTHFRAEFIKKDGVVFPVEVSIVASQTPGGSLYLLTARDITFQLAHEVARQRTLVKARPDNEPATNGVHHAGDKSQLIYQSVAFAAVMQQIRLVAPTGATVLITGETGTGKELIAKTIHRLSQRADRAFVTVDCGSIPPELIESYLFGYRKGAFTGATENRRGHLAAADGGTLFLDEIGELPLLMQTRLLRVLQEGEYTPLGDVNVQKVDVRVVAATNRDLKLWMEQGRFRSDLFYRLNVFPILSIPLRERKEDIYSLIGHFIKKFNTKFSKEISGVDGTTLERIAEYSFPGNVRELENMVERAFIVSSGKILPLDIPAHEPTPMEKPVLDLTDGTLTEFISFEDNQRKYIQFVLKSTKGKVSGDGGAAEILEMNPQTLFSKMRKLGIRR